MTEKRFKSENIDFSNFIVDLNSATSKGANTTKYKSYDTNTKKKCDELTDLLNRLNNENELLKKGYNKLKHRHSLLHDVCIEAECDRDRYHKDVVSLEKENKQLKQQVEDLYESDKSLRKFASNMTLNYTGICVPRRLFDEVLNILKDMEHNDLVEDLSKESIDTSANGC